MKEIKDKKNILEKLIDHMIENSIEHIKPYVDKLKSQNPNISNDSLAQKIVKRKSIKNGFIGAGTGLGGVLTLPATVPVDLYASWKIQISMSLAIAYIYGHTSKTTDFKTDIYLILAGDSAKEALKQLGIEVSKGVTKKAIEKHVTREVMKKIWKVIPQKIITKAGEKSLTSFTKLIPLIGAPIGYVFDWTSAKIIGRTAIKYYSGKN